MKTLFLFLTILAVSTLEAFAMPTPKRCELLLSLPGRRALLDKSFKVIDGKVKVAFFDADDTLRESATGKFIVKDADDVKILKNVAERIKELNKQGYLVAIVSNQAGIPKLTTFEEVDLAMRETVMKIRDLGAIVHHFDFAENKDHYRKPEAGMAEELARTLKRELGDHVEIDWANSFMVGDAAYKKGVDTRPDGTPGQDFNNSDRLFAEGLNIPFYEAREFFKRQSKPRAKKAKAKETGPTPLPDGKLSELVEETSTEWSDNNITSGTSLLDGAVLADSVSLETGDLAELVESEFRQSFKWRFNEDVPSDVTFKTTARAYTKKDIVMAAKALAEGNADQSADKGSYVDYTERLGEILDNLGRKGDLLTLATKTKMANNDDVEDMRSLQTIVFINKKTRQFIRIFTVEGRM